MPAVPETAVETAEEHTTTGVRRRWNLVLVALALLVGLAVIVIATRPQMPTLTWEGRLGPPGETINLDSLAATGEAFALLSGVTADGVVLWSSPDAEVWHRRPLPEAQSQLAALDDELIAYGTRRGITLAPDGDSWLVDDTGVVFPDEVRSRSSSGRPSVSGTRDALLAMSIRGDVWFSDGGSDFEMVISDPNWGPGQTVEVPFDSACSPPTRSSPDVPPVVETGDGFAALVSSNPDEPFGIWPVCEPDLWTSQDGRAWSDAGPAFGDSAYVYDLAWRDGRYVAVGGTGIGEPAVWASDDGLEWQESLMSESGIDVYSVTAGPAGWVVLGDESDGAATMGWTSTDGACWTPLPDEVRGTDAAVTDHRVLILDRTTYPRVWLGTPTGGSGAC